MVDYAYSNLAFNFGCEISEMQYVMAEANSIELLDCFGSVNRLIVTLSKISNPNSEVMKELDHYYTKRNCLHIELTNRLHYRDASRAENLIERVS